MQPSVEDMIYVWREKLDYFIKPYEKQIEQSIDTLQNVVLFTRLHHFNASVTFEDEIICFSVRLNNNKIAEISKQIDGQCFQITFTDSSSISERAIQDSNFMRYFQGLGGAMFEQLMIQLK